MRTAECVRRRQRTEFVVAQLIPGQIKQSFASIKNDCTDHDGTRCPQFADLTGRFRSDLASLHDGPTAKLTPGQIVPADSAVDGPSDKESVRRP